LAASATQPPARQLRILAIFALAVIFLAALWSALWLFLSNRAGGALDQWLAAERRAGREWTCPDRKISGYPFAVTLRCSRPRFRGEVAGRVSDGSLEELQAGVHLGHPRRLDLALHGPLILRSEANDFVFTASWAELSGAVDDLGARRPRGSLAGKRLAVTLETLREGDLNLRAATFAGQAEPSADQPTDAQFSLAATGLVFPTLDAIPGIDAPADIDGRGLLLRADLLHAPTRAGLEAWRMAGGALHLAALNIGKGPFRAQASGVLALDDEHRPAGKLDAALSGFEPIAERYGIPLAGVRLGGLLTNLLGGGKKPAAPGSLRLPWVLEDGGLSVGPFRTDLRLDPLY
jgi:hypothetical protein